MREALPPAKLNVRAMPSEDAKLAEPTLSFPQHLNSLGGAGSCHEVWKTFLNDAGDLFRGAVSLAAGLAHVSKFRTIPD